MSKFESFTSEGSLTQNRSADHKGKIFERNQTENLPTCQNVKIGKGGGGRQSQFQL
ncbi:MAG: hypothetical protein LBK06_07185 [Planctomycetaceae bacterium]|jgi:hypothetical protein|nr:hypothetical protein [Planctomycetaceae bacterium]